MSTRPETEDLPHLDCSRLSACVRLGKPLLAVLSDRVRGSVGKQRGATGQWRIGRSSTRPVLKHGPRSLTCTRVGGWKTRKRKETDWWEGLGLHHRPTMIFCERFEYERTCWDPKDGELCLSRAKPEETLVEARRCADVQIAFRTWV